MTSEGPRLFISYRRTDTADRAGRLRDALAARYGDESVFMDVVAIEPGDDFVVRMDEAVSAADVVLVVIGATWTSTSDAKGRRRLDDPADHVRREITTALTQGVRVLPVLVDGAVMPGRDVLPAALEELSTRNALRLEGATWETDVDMLITKIGEWLDAVAPRTLTVVCSGLRNGTNIGEHLDPGDIQRVFTSVNGALQASVQGHGGIVRTAVDLVFGFFVGPVDASADRALTGLRAGLAGRARVQQLEAELSLELVVSVAAHTAEIERPGSPADLVGEPNDIIATVARLHDHAAATGVTASDATHRLVADRVLAEPTGPVRLRRLPVPVDTWRVDAVLAQ